MGLLYLCFSVIDVYDAADCDCRASAGAVCCNVAHCCFVLLQDAVDYELPEISLSNTQLPVLPTSEFHFCLPLKISFASVESALLSDPAAMQV